MNHIIRDAFVIARHTLSRRLDVFNLLAPCFVICQASSKTSKASGDLWLASKNYAGDFVQTGRKMCRFGR